MASLGLGLNGSSEGTGIRFSLTESGLKLLKGDASGPAMFSDEEGGDFRRMHLSLKPASLASGREPLTLNTAWRYSFYSPEMNLLSETELRTTTGTPLILYEYIWFNGHPVAQVDAGIVNHWTFTDHLGTPILQTDSASNIYWRAEHEPYGKVFALRTADQHQPLRFPGQEAEQLNLGPDGATERSYNIFRWYRNGWGRYTQADPIGLQGGLNLFGYALGDPISLVDDDGLAVIPTTNPELTCFFCTVFAESRDQPAPCQYAVASVIVNRLADDRAHGRPASICGVVSKPGAFMGYKDGNYMNCENCSFPPNDKPDVDGFVANFENPFPVAPDARFFGKNRRGSGYIAVPYPPCPYTYFYNEDPGARRRRRK